MKICIVGTGYVGLVTGACFAEMGNNVTCIDKDSIKIDCLQQGDLPIYEPGLEEIVRHNIKERRLVFSTSLADGMQEADFIFLCVGTPSLADGSCDTGFVLQAAREVAANIQKEVVLVTKSTVPVGTAEKIRQIVENELQKRGVEVDFFVASNPEFLKEGAAVNDFMKPDRIVVGTDNEQVAELFRVLYAPFSRNREKMLIMDVKSAEMTKYAANCMLATKISFINEMARICEYLGADIGSVRAGISEDPRIGQHFLYPGVGYGGSCFPKDVRSLVHSAVDAGFEPKLLQAVESVNNSQKELLADFVLRFFADKGGVIGKTLALWGLAFKANTDDMREASSLTIIKKLTAVGMRILAFDPVADKRAADILHDNPLVEIVNEQYGMLANADGLAVVTEWNQFRTPDFTLIKKQLRTQVIFDGRNLYFPDVVRNFGFQYFGIGRK